MSDIQRSQPWNKTMSIRARTVVLGVPWEEGTMETSSPGFSVPSLNTEYPVGKMVILDNANVAETEVDREAMIKNAEAIANLTMVAKMLRCRMTRKRCSFTLIQTCFYTQGRTLSSASLARPHTLHFARHAIPG